MAQAGFTSVEQVRAALAGQLRVGSRRVAGAAQDADLMASTDSDRPEDRGRRTLALRSMDSGSAAPHGTARL